MSDQKKDKDRAPMGALLSKGIEKAHDGLTARKAISKVLSDPEFKSLRERRDRLHRARHLGLDHFDRAAKTIEDEMADYVKNTAIITKVESERRGGDGTGEV